MKTFKAFWGNSFSRPGNSKVGSSFFTEDNGYDSEDVAAIDALEVGEKWMSADYGSEHTVERLS